MSSDIPLYGIRKPNFKSSSSKEISSSTTLSFTSTLSSLLSSTPSTSSSSPATGRPRPSKNKKDIFSSHNRNLKKRAARDLDEDSDAGGARGGSGRGGVDEATLHRSKRKLKEKAKIYKEMKRSDYVSLADGDGAGEEGDNGLVDFDRKWAERQSKHQDTESDTDSLDEIGDPDQNEIVEYEDEFGRLRKGTKREASAMERRKQNQLLGQEELSRFSARPSLPSKLIYGDTVQTLAFNPDEGVAEKMEEIARKRDKSLTPPPQEHYRAEKEFRIKGVGFYSFSRDEGTREEEMKALEREREETERMRREREGKKDARKKEIEERRRQIGEKRARKQADSFLEDLGAGMEGMDKS